MKTPRFAVGAFWIYRGDILGTMILPIYNSTELESISLWCYMSDRFIKFIPSEEAMFLVFHKPNAFRLLTIIATRARRVNGLPDGLTIGQCHIGDWKSCGFSEREYRTAKSILEMRRHLKIVETCRTRKKSTTGSTTMGTLVELISSNVYDINKNVCDDRIDDRPTTDRRPTDDEQERTRKKKKEKEQQQKPAAPVVVFSSIQKLEDKSISQKHKEEICQQYPQEIVDAAVAAITEHSFKFDGNMLKAIRAACKGKWNPNKGDNKSILENRKLAHMLAGAHKFYRFEAWHSYLEIIKGPTSEIISYNISHQKFCSEVERIGKINIDKALKALKP